MIARGFREVGIGEHRLNLPMDAVLYFVAPRGARFHTTIHVAGAAMQYPVAITPMDLATIEVRPHGIKDPDGNQIPSTVVLHYRFHAHSKEMAQVLREASKLQHDEEIEDMAEIDADICTSLDEWRAK